MKQELAEKFIGVDIGGSHITAAEIIPGRNIVKSGTKRRQAVDSHGTSESIIHAWTSVLKALIGDKNVEKVKIGIAMPGPFDYQEGISYIKDLNKYEALYGMNVRQILSEELAVPASNFVFKNDAEAFLHGEVVSLGFSAHLKIIGVTLGTGLGSAKSIRGKTKDVFRAIEPFRQGIAEDYISSRWFQKRYNELCGKSLKNVEELVSNTNQDLKDRLFEEFGNNLGIFLNDFVKEEDANVIVIGGNIAKCLDLYVEYLKINIEDKSVKIYQSTLWEDAALIGALNSSLIDANASKIVSQ